MTPFQRAVMLCGRAQETEKSNYDPYIRKSIEVGIMAEARIIEPMLSDEEKDFLKTEIFEAVEPIENIAEIWAYLKPYLTGELTHEGSAI